MSKMTQTAFNRKFEFVKDVGWVRRAQPLPVERYSQHRCLGACGVPMMVSPGQIMRYHKACKPIYKAKLKYHGQ